MLIIFSWLTVLVTVLVMNLGDFSQTLNTWFKRNQEQAVLTTKFLIFLSYLSSFLDISFPLSTEKERQRDIRLPIEDTIATVLLLPRSRYLLSAPPLGRDPFGLIYIRVIHMGLRSRVEAASHGTRSKSRNSSGLVEREIGESRVRGSCTRWSWCSKGFEGHPKRWTLRFDENDSRVGANYADLASKYQTFKKSWKHVKTHIIRKVPSTTMNDNNLITSWSNAPKISSRFGHASRN